MLDLRPAELAVLEPLGEQAHARSVPEYQLHPVRAFGAEDVDRPVERIGPHDLAHQSRQAFSPFEEIDGLHRHHHPYRTCRANHLAAFSAPMIAATIAASAPGQTHTIEPSMSNSIECGRATGALFAASS
jgi:hypothetical protein